MPDEAVLEIEGSPDAGDPIPIRGPLTHQVESQEVV